jgi:hypothetical protein
LVHAPVKVMSVAEHVVIVMAQLLHAAELNVVDASDVLVIVRTPPGQLV